MRKLFKNHHIYTFIAGLAGFAWVYGQPPLVLPEPVETAGGRSAQGGAAVRQDRQPQAVEPVSIGTIITKQGPGAQNAPEAAGETTATLARLPAAGIEDAPAQVLRVAADKLRMRSGPSPDASTLAAYPLGTQVEVLARSGKWIEVRNLTDGTVGWMYADYLAETE